MRTNFAAVILTCSCILSALTVLAQTPVLLRTFNNPTPSTGDNFSRAVAGNGTDRVLIGAPLDDTGSTNAGAAYLFGTNGTLLMTFTNPSPASFFGYGDHFGAALMSLGTDRVLISAPDNDEGVVYVFNTNGALLTIISNPDPFSGYSQFGASMAALSNERVIIGAPVWREDPGSIEAIGVVYLMSTNGTVVKAFLNPDPQETSEFGFSVAPFGNDRVLIGSRSLGFGEAYLFNTNGTLLMNFTNPTPAGFDYFGHSVAAIGTDRVLVGAPYDDLGATDAGVAYVFNTNGILLTTITNPTPAVSDAFAARVTVLGSDRLIISSIFDDLGATDTGATYVLRVQSRRPVAPHHHQSHAGGSGRIWRARGSARNRLRHYRCDFRRRGRDRLRERVSVQCSAPTFESTPAFSEHRPHLAQHCGCFLAIGLDRFCPSAKHE
jgi:hypothetical protein